MKEVRIGNDIAVEWSLERDGQPFELSGLRLSLYLKGVMGKELIEDYSVTGNVINWTFRGKQQRMTGIYSLVLVCNEAEDGMITTDVCDFVKLVECSCKAGGNDGQGVHTETIAVTSQVVTGVASVVDSKLSSTSSNPVENRVVTAALDGKVDKVAGKGLSANNYTTAEKNKLAGLQNYDDAGLRAEIARLDSEQQQTASNVTALGGELTELSAKLTIEEYTDITLVIDSLPTYGKVYFEKPLEVGTQIKAISFNGAASFFYWVNDIGTLYTDVQIKASSAPLTLDRVVYGIATPDDTSTKVTITYGVVGKVDVLPTLMADVQDLNAKVVTIENKTNECKNEVAELSAKIGMLPTASVADIITEITDDAVQTIEVTTPASYYGQAKFAEPIKAGTQIKSIVIEGGVSWFYWVNPQSSLYTDIQVKATNEPYILDRDIYGVAAPSSTPVKVTIVTSDGVKVVDKVARIDADVQTLKNGKKWQGKTIVAFGDSITHFIGSDNKTYSEHLAELTGANVINCGIGGSTYRQRATPQDSTTDENVARAALDIVNMVKAAITQNFTAQVNAAALITTHQPYTLDYEVQVNNLMSIDWSKVDAVIFFGGTNDFYNVGQMLGEDNSTSLSETKGAINYILTEMCKTYPNVRINFLTPIVRYVDPPQFSTSKQYEVGDVTMYQGARYKFVNAHSGAWNAADVQTITSYEARVDATWGDNYKNAGDMTLREYGEALGAFVKKIYHIVPIDMYNIGWNRVNFDNFFVDADATHPLSGFKALAKAIAERIKVD